MNIPTYLDRDNYLQNPIMRRFLKEKNIEFVDNRADYLSAIKNFSNMNEKNENEVKQWLLKVVREGSKEFCYRKIYGINDIYKNTDVVKKKIMQITPNCPMKNVLEYHNTGERELIEYSIQTNDIGETVRIGFTFSKLMLCGELGKMGETTIFPIFVDVYLEEGFIVSRAKAKSTVYNYDSENAFLVSEQRVNTMDYAITAIDNIIDIFGFGIENDKKIIKKKNAEMLYKLYQKYSFTPKEVEEKVEGITPISIAYINKMFEMLQLKSTNKEKALLDMKIFTEKYISINGNNENIFKADRDAYLIKVSADDEIELTRIDTMSNKTVPLQCTEAFFDSKKSVVKGKKCNKLNLCFKRHNELYLKNNPLVVQFGSNKDYGYFKTIQYAEEEDIQNVLQAVFNNY